MEENDRMKNKSKLILYMNYKRVSVMTILLMATIPFLLLRFHLYDHLSNTNLYCVLAYECCLIIFTIINLVKPFHKDKNIVRCFLQIQLAVILFGLTGLGYLDYSITKSLLIMVMAGLCFIFVPIIHRNERLVILSGQFFIMMVFCLYSRASYKQVIDFVILQLLVSILAAYEHTIMLRFRLTTGRLKKSTISSEHDALTGLLNRRALDARLGFLLPQCIKRSIPIGVIELDIDYFKKYNDTFGHPQGDQCLIKIAQVLYNTLEDTSAIVTRTGGEEFVIVLQDIDRRQLIQLATKIRKNVEKLRMPHAYYAVSDYVTVSVGATFSIPSEDTAFDQLYEDADQALYLAKKSGRNCVAFEGKIYGSNSNQLQKKRIIL